MITMITSDLTMPVRASLYLC